MLDIIVLADGVGWGHMAGWGWAGMMLGWILMSTLVAIVAWALLGNGRPGNRAVEVLDERFARGEIDRDDYYARKKELGR
jgi:putative membrane protein